MIEHRCKMLGSGAIRGGTLTRADGISVLEGKYKGLESTYSLWVRVQTKLDFFTSSLRARAAGTG